MGHESIIIWNYGNIGLGNKNQTNLHRAKPKRKEVSTRRRIEEMKDHGDHGR
jgi:hypothetical protein